MHAIRKLAISLGFTVAVVASAGAAEPPTSGTLLDPTCREWSQWAEAERNGYTIGFMVGRVLGEASLATRMPEPERSVALAILKAEGKVRRVPRAAAVALEVTLVCQADPSRLVAVAFLDALNRLE